MTKFIFDLDGTITQKETLPLIAKHFSIEKEIKEITIQTLEGNIPFIESFIKRVFILGALPVTEIKALLTDIPLYPKIFDFIQHNKENCIIATGNVNFWVEGLLAKVGCTTYSSEGQLKDNKIVKLLHILKKEKVVQHYKDTGERVVFIGDSNNDVEAMRYADISIACGLTHEPAKSVLTCTDYLVYTEEALCRQLYQLS